MNNSEHTYIDLFTVCNGDKYKLPSLTFVRFSHPSNIGWYPVSTFDSKRPNGSMLSYWDGIQWSQLVPAEVTADIAGKIAMQKSEDNYWWMEPWWIGGSKVKG